MSSQEVKDGKVKHNLNVIDNARVQKPTKRIIFTLQLFACILRKNVIDKRTQNV